MDCNDPSGPLDSQATKKAIDGSPGARQSPELYQPPGSSPLPKDVLGTVSCQLQLLLELLREDVVMVVLPPCFLSEGNHDHQGAVLCSRRAAPPPDGLAANLAEMASAVLGAVAERQEPTTLVLRLGSSAEADGTPTVAWPLSWGGDEPAALLLPGHVLEELPAGVSSTVGAVAAAISAVLEVAYSQRTRERAAAALLEVARTAGSTLELDEVLSLVVERASRLVGADRCGLWLLARDGSTLLPSAQFGMPDEVRRVWCERPLSLETEPLSGEAIRWRKPVLVLDAVSDPRTDKEAVRFFGDKTILVLPMIAKGQAQGTLFMNHVDARHHYSRGEIGIAMAIAGQAAIAIQNARLYREVEEKGQQLLRAFRRVGDVLAAGLDQERTFQLVADLAADQVRAAGCVILLLDEAGGELMPVASRGLPIDVARGDCKPGWGCISWEVVRERAPRLVADLTSVEGPCWMGRAEASHLRSYLGVPLMLRDKPIGALSVLGSKPGQFTESDVEVLLSFSRQVAIAIENARLFSALERRVRELAGLEEISRSIASLTNLEETCRELTESVAQLLQVEKCALLELEEGGELIPQLPAFGFAPEELAECKLRVEKGHDLLSGPVCPIWPVGSATAPSSDGRGSRALLVPLRAQDRPIGAILAVRDTGVGFSEDDARLLTILAGNAAAIFQNALLYQRVERERDELDTIINNTCDGIVILDGEGRVERTNAAVHTMTGWTAEEMVGRPCEEIVLDPLAEGPRQGALGSSFREAVEKREPLPYFEGYLRTEEGGLREIEASYSVVKPGPGGRPGGILIARDVGKVKEVERMKTEFVSMVSHELRTPLGLIKGYASTLRNPRLSLDQATIQRFLSGIDGAADRLGRLIENLLSGSRIDAGLFHLSIQQIDLSRLLSAAVSNARSMAKSREISLELPWRRVEIEGDQLQLELVMDNLLNNALKYSPEGKAIRVELRESGKEVEVRVVDQGVGIRDEHLPKLFGKFYRVEGEIGRRAPGSGLGLYICRNIVEAHGGRIWVDSKPGEGSTFVFVLPVRQSNGVVQSGGRGTGSETEMEVVHE